MKQLFAPGAVAAGAFGWTQGIDLAWTPARTLESQRQRNRSRIEWINHDTSFCWIKEYFT
jgi:hypothetical protein